MEPVVIVGEDRIFPLVFDSIQTLEKFWDKARQFPTVYGHEITNDIQAFVSLFFTPELDGTLSSNGLFWVLNDFTGVFYLTEIREDTGELTDANAHYTFFDRRHRGRAPLVREMLQFWFNKYGFQRLSAEIPNYVTPQARHFAQECGMSYEGKRRKAAKYKGSWFDVNIYGILRDEVLNGQDI